jgi:hypothetical protein
VSTWKIYWLVWFLVTFVTFIVPELWALFTNAKNTLSWTLWDLEQFLPGTSLWKWTALHFLIGGILVVLLVWLIGHLVFGIWT